MSPTRQPRELGDYLAKRLEHIEQCKGAFDSYLEEQHRELDRIINAPAFQSDDPEVGRTFHHLEYVVANTFRYTMLVGLCSFLEEAIKSITKLRVCDYGAKLKADKKGNWLEKHLRILVAETGINLDCVSGDIKKFHDLITLRNCVVHAWGNVAGDRRPDAVRDAVGRIETAAIFSDGFLKFGDQVLPEAIIAAERIAEHSLFSPWETSIT